MRARPVARVCVLAALAAPWAVVACRGADTASTSEMKAAIAALEKERDALRFRIDEGMAKDAGIAGMPTTGVRVGVPTDLARELTTRVITGFVDQVTLKLANITVHKAGSLKKIVTIGEYEIDVRIEDVTAKLETGAPTMRFGGDRIGLDLPVRVKSGTGSAVIDFRWDGKNISGAVCGDMEIQETVAGQVRPDEYPVAGALHLAATSQRILASPRFPEVKINIKVQPSAASWAAVQGILDSQEGLCGWVVDKVDILGLLRKVMDRGFDVRLPTEKIKPVAVPVGIAPTMTVRDHEVTVAVKVGQLAITDHMIWLGADVALGDVVDAAAAPGEKAKAGDPGGSTAAGTAKDTGAWRRGQ